MVKGISRQVIVLEGADTKFFEQAIFLLKEDALQNGGYTDDALLKEAKRLMGQHSGKRKRNPVYGPLWACGGGLAMGLLWMLSLLI